MSSSHTLPFAIIVHWRWWRRRFHWASHDTVAQLFFLSTANFHSSRAAHSSSPSSLQFILMWNVKCDVDDDDDVLLCLNVPPCSTFFLLHTTPHFILSHHPSLRFLLYVCCSLSIRIHNYAYKSAHLITWICDKKYSETRSIKTFSPTSHHTSQREPGCASNGTW